MKEYIKLFSDLQSADGYIIADIPFTSTVASMEQNLRCNQENKKLEVSGNTVIVVDKPTPTILYLQDGSTVEFTGTTITSVMISRYTLTLVGVELGNTVTSISKSAFENCASLSAITIPDSVTSIGTYAFSACTGLNSVTIGSGVTSIGTNTFNGCTSLSTITIPNSVTRIGGYAFRDCSGLTSVTIGSGVTSIGDSAFSGCTSLSSVTIGSGVTSIGGSAFYNCSGLTSITIPSGVTSIGVSAFTSVINVNYTGSATGSPWGARYINAYIENNIVYDSSAKTQLYECLDKTITDFVIPDSVTSIGNYAFSSCSGLTGITIPSGVTSIGISAFQGVSGKIRFNKVYSTFINKINSATTFTYIIEFNIQEIPSGYNISSMLSVGSDKGTLTYNIYTDLEECKAQALALAGQYTIVNVYNIDGSPWE